MVSKKQVKRVISIVLNNFKQDSRVLKECISLKKAGYNVKVIALHEEPLKEYDEIMGIPVHRIRLRTRRWPKKKIIQLIKYAEFVYKVIKQYENVNIIHCNDLETLPIGVIVKKIFNKNAKIVYDAHEYEIERSDLKGIYKKIIKCAERKLIRYADKIITVSNAIANEYAKLYEIEKPAVVLNTPLYRRIKKENIFRKTLGIEENKTIFLYQGRLSRGRGIEIIIETFKNFKDTNAVVVFMGYGELEEFIKENSKKYSNIYFHPAVSPDVLLDYTSSADFGIHMAQSHCLSYYYALPNKIFEYIMAEIPIIVSDLPEMAKLVNTYNIGIVARENTPEGLKEAIRQIMQLDKKRLERNIQQVKLMYNWEKQEEILLQIYKELHND